MNLGFTNQGRFFSLLSHISASLVLSVRFPDLGNDFFSARLAVGIPTANITEHAKALDIELPANPNCNLKVEFDRLFPIRAVNVEKEEHAASGNP